jgi:hypothetical protein
MSVTFTKLFSSITESTVWCEPSDTRIVWITMLAMSDKHGRVFGSVPGLANRSQVSVEATRLALTTFLEPDLDSRTKDHEGRRIRPMDDGGGWVLLNHGKYRAIRDESERRVYKAEHEKQRRVKRKASDVKGFVYYAQDGELVKIGFSATPWARVGEMRTASPGIRLVGLEHGTMATEAERQKQFAHCHHEREWFTLTEELAQFVEALEEIPMPERTLYTEHQFKDRSVAPKSPVKRGQTRGQNGQVWTDVDGHGHNADADADADKNKNNVSGSSPKNPHPGGAGDGQVVAKHPDLLIYEVYPRREGRGLALTAIAKAVKRMVKGEADRRPMDATEARRWLWKATAAYAKSPAGQQPDRTKVPHPATWFNQSRYLDDPTNWQHTGDDRHGRTAKPTGKTDGTIDAAKSFLEDRARQLGLVTQDPGTAVREHDANQCGTDAACDAAASAEVVPG